MAQYPASALTRLNSLTTKQDTPSCLISPSVLAAGSPRLSAPGLAPAVTAALDAGWTPQALGAFTGASTDGVRSPFAVLAAKLSLAGLPAPYARPARPPWCGECDEVTRMLGSNGDAPWPYPRCKPLTGLR